MERTHKLLNTVFAASVAVTLAAGCGGTLEGPEAHALGPAEMTEHVALPSPAPHGIEPVVLPHSVTHLPGGVTQAVEQPIVLPGGVTQAVEQPIVLPSRSKTKRWSVEVPQEEEPTDEEDDIQRGVDLQSDVEWILLRRAPQPAVHELAQPPPVQELAHPPVQELAQPPVMRKDALQPTRGRFESVVWQGHCPAGLKQCGHSCVNTLFDPENCGECARSCTTPQCFFGRCVAPQI
jgi:hypothetical protein